MKVLSPLALLASLLAVAAQQAWYRENWCGGGLQFLDDRDCAKTFPDDGDRDHSCSTPLLSSPPAGYQLDGALPSMEVDLSLPVTDPVIKACLIVTKRVANASAPSGVSLYNKYFCNPSGKSTLYETWSSSKIFAMANAAGHLRAEENACSAGAFGLDSSSSGKHAWTQLGDLATIVCSYDHTAGYTSNSLSSYFHDLGFRSRINELVHDWLGFPDLSLGGNYGEATPSDLGFTLLPCGTTGRGLPSLRRYSKINRDRPISIVNGSILAPSLAASDEECRADKDPWPVTYVNSLTALAAAEMTRRIALHREVDPSLRFPGATWRDMQNILYGAEQSALFPGETWGGMTADTAIYLQSAPAVREQLAVAANKKDFRIFSKLGAGYSSRQVGEVVTNAHLCLPSRDRGAGLEITISVEGSVPYDYDLSKVDQHVAQAVGQIADFALAQ